MKKNLLTESEIRKFMKFANLGPLAENFVEKIDEEHDPDWGEEEVEDVGGVEKKAGDVGGDDVHDLVKRLVQKIADWADEEAGVEVSVEDTAEVGGDEEVEDVSAEEEVEDVGGEELGGEELGGEVSIAGDADEPSGGIPSDEDELVAEVTKRVAARLLKENKK